MFLKNKKICRLAMLFLVAMGLLLVASAATADNNGRERQKDLPNGVEKLNALILKKVITYRESREEVYQDELDADEVIDEKVGIIQVREENGEEGVTEIYRFDSFVEVYNGKREKISLDELPVPCLARLYYYPTDRAARYLHRIEVLTEPSGAKRSWDEEFRDL